MKYEHFPKENTTFCTQSRKDRHPLRKQNSNIEAATSGRRFKKRGAAAFGRRPPFLGFYIDILFSQRMSILSRLNAKSDFLIWKVFIFHLTSNTLTKKHNISFSILHFISFTPLFFCTDYTERVLSTALHRKV